MMISPASCHLKQTQRTAQASFLGSSPDTLRPTAFQRKPVLIQELATEHPDLQPSASCSRWNTGRSPGLWGHLHCPYGCYQDKPAETEPEGHWGPPDATLPDLLQAFGDGREMPGTMSQAELVMTLVVIPGPGGSLVGRREASGGRSWMIWSRIRGPSGMSTP